ncbi:MAG: DUF2065 domain-containing protein [Rhodocyclaceae bacterium]|jgi:uncharacterized protein YjeT (DUF2065 family)|nr:DUF2065 domain-containing protein [Rhodocyclaceae bacterium]MCE2723074.1 DUF2065 domain-containing protein [Betaproteobacteria bacterium]MCA3025113.1 DUF2065 domain-containing protein [Rhodocyclaceae bacterium]MCA3029706.1 DUF2065 domain-containing protein [Rhodocyclaceae bacterium]MCA3031186.1 DUF2065 domain-containing protein [Rhodocyclaceae bacterium]
MDFWDVLLAGGALMLIFEGIMPFVAPEAWKKTMRQVVDLSSGQLRFVGMLAIAAGLFLLSFISAAN